MSELWYRDGLRFRCTQCGNCCTGEPGFVWVDEEEMVAIAEHLGEPMEVVRDYYAKAGHRGRTLREKENGDCVFYDRDAGCLVYPVRPRQCRTWPFWANNVKSEKAWQRTAEDCPGCNQGELISVDEILARVKEISL